MSVDPYSKLQKTIGYRFRNRTLLERAITHRSSGSRHNERLEFLGDSILGMVVAETLYNLYGDATEGQLTRMRARLVRRESLAAVARRLELGDTVRLGPGESRSGGHDRDSILADAVEGVLGAVYLDGGLEAAKDCVLAWLSPLMETLDPHHVEKDNKTRLQELLQKKGYELPVYHVSDTSGDPHNRTFRVTCSVTDMDISAIGTGTSRRRAEQQAAGLVLEQVASH